MYKLHIDRRRNLVEIAIVGFWRRQDVESFCTRLRLGLGALGASLGTHTILCDLTEAGVAPAEAIAALGGIFANPAFAGFKARRCAFFTPSALSRLQMNLLTGVREGIAVFEDRATALAWLEEPVRAAAA